MDGGGRVNSAGGQIGHLGKYMKTCYDHPSAKTEDVLGDREGWSRFRACLMQNKEGSNELTEYTLALGCRPETSQQELKKYWNGKGPDDERTKVETANEKRDATNERKGDGDGGRDEREEAKTEFSRGESRGGGIEKKVIERFMVEDDPGRPP
ncbi:16386_t:CDS:2 [Acaulospora colombiana]|uniref:16386_t:CDS:1 n=1 Tax=Acaulospora colombiana TaxID=27376 RepID=A0ACA9PZC8_9GLOM|nr:16386_t:CDS:2 [Acaulospora colombiana]